MGVWKGEACASTTEGLKKKGFETIDVDGEQE